MDPIEKVEISYGNRTTVC